MEVVVNISNTQYEIIEDIVKDLKWTACHDAENEEFDLVWQDNAVNPEYLSQFSSSQRINHFPGMFTIARKDDLARNLKAMQKIFPQAYDFFPKTWILPKDFADLKTQFSKKQFKTLICKPEAQSQGKGIFLTRKLEEIPEKCVVQRYLHKPYLLDGLKFDLRIYVLVTSCDPLKVFVHQDGLVRLATDTYSPPNSSNLQNQFMHLTNYAINKNSSKFEFNLSLTESFKGHKRSLKALFDNLRERGEDIEKLWEDIEDIIVKTLCVAQPCLSYLYKSSLPNDPTGSICFQILGFDIFINSHLKPYLLEVNHTPSFSADTPLDYSIKKSVITDALQMLGIGQGSVSITITTHTKRSKEIKTCRSEIKEKWIHSRDYFEDKFKGGFIKIFPNNRAEFYHYLAAAKDVWIDQLGVKKKKKSKTLVISAASKNFMRKPVQRTVFPQRNAVTPLMVSRSRESVPKPINKPVPYFKNYGAFIRPRVFEFEQTVKSYIPNRDASKQG